MGAALAAVDEAVTSWCDDALAAWVRDGTELGATVVRCARSEPDPEAVRRLDLAMRVLHGQAASFWCRAVTGGTAVVLAWPLPARAIALVDASGQHAVVVLLAVGQPHDGVDLWRIDLLAGGEVARRADELLAVLR